MSITSKRGDGGETDLLFGHRVAKTHPRVIACGTIDELNASLGLARTTTQKDLVRERIGKIQNTLIILMGEVGTKVEDLDRFREQGFQSIGEETVQEVTDWIEELETEHGVDFRKWAIPGEAGNLAGAHLDMARTICRRAEREVVGMTQGGLLLNGSIPIYLNRVSDLCWLLARFEEG